MKRKFIVDSSVGFSQQEIEKYNLGYTPFGITIDGKEYIDTINITNEEIYQALRDGKDLKTSQPNLYTTQELIKEAAENNDEVIIVTLPRYLSGTFSQMVTTAENLGLTNVYCVDPHIFKPAREMTLAALEMEDKTVEEIIQMYKDSTQECMTTFCPENLTQLKKGGRISPAVATFGNLLKVKIALKLEKDEPIEKADIVRSYGKVFETFKGLLEKYDFSPETHSINLIDTDAPKTIASLTEYLEGLYPGIELTCYPLVTAITVHAGVGAVGIQIIKKIK